MADGTDPAVPFEPYVARDRRIGDLSFDFLINDEVGRSWYDQKPDQTLFERLWCRDRLRPGGVAVDCGAHHGLMTVLFAHWVGPDGRVFSYEALPANAELVRRNVALNRLGNVSVRALAVCDRVGSIAIHLNQGNVVARTDGTLRIDGTSLDHDLGPEIRVDLLKLDVEGSELQALEGARRVLAQKPAIDLELHNMLVPDRADTLRRIFAILDEREWQFAVAPEILSPIEPVDGRLDLGWLAGFDNPHVFCTRRETVRGRLARLWRRRAG